jgi:hypothetical protein
MKRHFSFDPVRQGWGLRVGVGKLSCMYCMDPWHSINMQAWYALSWDVLCSAPTSLIRSNLIAR